MKSSSLPPSMARRERVKSTCIRLRNTNKNYNENIDKNVSELTNNNLIPLERSMVPFLPIRGSNLAAILRCQVSRYDIQCIIYNVYTMYNKYYMFLIYIITKGNDHFYIYVIEKN